MFGLKSINKSKINLIWLDKFSVKWERNATTGQTFPHSTLDSDRRCVFYFFAAFIFLLLSHNRSSSSPSFVSISQWFEKFVELVWLFFFFIVWRCSSRTHRAATDRSLTKSKRRCVFGHLRWRKKAVNEKKTQIRRFMHRKECEGPLYGVANLMWLLSHARDDIPSPNDVVFTLELVDFLLLLFGQLSIAPSMVLASLPLQQQVQLSRSH